MKKAILLIMLYNFIPSYGDVEFIARNGNSNAINAIQNDRAEKFIPNYSVSSANQAGREFGGMDDGALKAKADQKIVEAKASKLPTPTSTVVQTSERPVLDNFEQTEIFEKAKEIYANPAKKLAEIVSKDCKETINDSTDPYTREMSIEERTDIEYEEKTCEKPNEDVKCEKTLRLECGKTEDCEGHGLVVGSIKADDINWSYQSPYLHLGTLSDNYWGGWCTIYDRQVEFEVKNKHLITELKLVQVSYDDFLWIKINDNTVFIGPHGGSELQVITRGWRNRLVVSNGNSVFGCDGGANQGGMLDIDLRGYLKEGANTIWTRTIVGGAGEFYMKVKVRQQCCSDVREVWLKKCY